MASNPSDLNSLDDEYSLDEKEERGASETRPPIFSCLNLDCGHVSPAEPALHTYQGLLRGDARRDTFKCVN